MPFHFITSLEQMRQLLPTAADVRLEFMQSYFDRAAFQLLRPHLGPATLAGLSSDTPTPAQLELREILRPAVATYGYLLYAGDGTQTLTAQGPRRTGSPDSKPLNEKETAQWYEQLRRNAYGQLEEGLVFLEDRPTEFAAWHASKWSTIWPGHFFATADDFARYAPGDWTRLRFRNAWPRINAVEAQQLRQVLGRPLLGRLLDEQHDTAHAEVVDLIRTAVAGLAVDDELAEEAAATALDELRRVLQLELLTYPEFEASPSYTPEYVASDQSNNFFNGIF